MVLHSIETLGERATGRIMALNSIENRVFDVEMENEERLIIKFYRPGRWSKETVLDEHQFIQDLDAAEIPVAAPFKFSSGSTLNTTSDGILFSVFPKKRGRSPQELDVAQLEWIGRFIARMHLVGEQKKADHRLKLSVAHHGRESLKILKDKQLLAPELKSRYEDCAEKIFQKTEPLLAAAPTFRIHGDCHMSNLLMNSDGFFFLDFDDMMNGPAIQDLWLLVNRAGQEGKEMWDPIIRGYEQFRPFDDEQLKLVEGLRALRIIHYSAWIARRWTDPSFPRLFPEFAG
jgi:Ser/Thr protein kinase RdoA (MazF antagonist)